MRRPRRRSKVLPVALLGSLAVAACNRVVPDQWAGTVDTSNGVVAVHNPVEPIWPAGTVTLTEMWRTDPDDTLASGHAPRTLALIGTRLLVLDSDARRILTIDAASGAAGVPIGAGGGGPGELERPMAVAELNGELAVLDAGRRSLERFGLDGEYRSSLPLGVTTFSALPWPGGLLLSTLRPDRRPVIVTGDGRQVVVSLGQDLGGDRPVARPGCVRFSVIDSFVVHSCRDRPEWFVHDTGRGLVRQVLSARQPVQRTEAEIEAHIERLTRLMAGRVPPDAAQAMLTSAREDGKIRTSHGKLTSDGATGLVTILDQDNEDWAPTDGTLLLFTRDGRFMSEVTIPAVWHDYTVVEGSIYAVEERPDGGRSVVRYRLTWPDEVGRYMEAHRSW